MLRKYRTDIQVEYMKKIKGIKGYLGVYAITSESIDSAERIVIERTKNRNKGNEYKFKIKQSYEMDHKKFISEMGEETSYKGKPEKRGIWGEWIIEYKNK